MIMLLIIFYILGGYRIVAIATWTAFLSTYPILHQVLAGKFSFIVCHEDRVSDRLIHSQ